MSQILVTSSSPLRMPTVAAIWMGWKMP